MEKQNGKLKILHLLRILATESDKEHPITITSIINELSQLGISAERKSLYNDISALKECGYDVKTVRSKDVGYYIDDVPFRYEDAEAFWDMLHAQTLFDEKKVNELKRKLESSVSLHEKKKLRMRSYTTEKLSSKKDSFKRNLDIIHEAVFYKKKISFTYTDPILRFESSRKKKTFHTVSPYVVSCKDGKLFLIAGSEDNEGLSHFYIDKIENIQITKIQATDVREIAGDLDFDLNCYSKGLFDEYAKTTQSVTLNCEKSILSTITELYDIKESEYTDEDRYNVTFDAEISEDLLAWLFINHSAVKIVEPKALAETMANAAKSIYISYI